MKNKKGKSVIISECLLKLMAKKDAKTKNKRRNNSLQLALLLAKGRWINKWLVIPEWLLSPCPFKRHSDGNGLNRRHNRPICQND